MKILGLIPARGGSKGIPGKNIKKLAGKELIRYTIEAGLACSSIDELIVSTEDTKIAEISRKAGASVPFMRPVALASDQSPTIDTVLQALDFFAHREIHFDAVCLLQPTTPFRTTAQIEQAIEQFISTDADSLISVREVPHQFNPHWIFEASEDSDYLRLATGEAQIIPRRQDLPRAYYRDGAIYITSREVLINQRSFYGQRLTYCQLDQSPGVNLDTMEDWYRAEKLMEDQS
jgi:CMP-N,N'-diacetyllegionaminic acid synthase